MRRSPIRVRPGSWWVIVRALVDHDRRQSTGGDHRGDRAELLDHPPDHPVDLAGEAIDHAGLQALHGVLADDRAGPGRLDLAQLGGAGGKRVNRDLDARRERAAEELAAPLTTSKLVEVPKSTTMWSTVQRVGGEGVDDPVGADLLRVVDGELDPGT